MIKGRYRNRKYDDSIDSLTTLMYDSLAEKNGKEPGNLKFGYPSITRLIKFVKNLQHHELKNIPKDYRTQVNSFGNLFTFSCIIILSFYAFIEMVNIWLYTIKNTY